MAARPVIKNRSKNALRATVDGNNLARSDERLRVAEERRGQGTLRRTPLNPRRQCWATSSRRAFRHARLFPFARGVGQPHAESTILNSWGAGEARGGGAAGEVAINTCKILSINCSPATCGGYGSWQQRCKRGWHPVLPANGFMGEGTLQYRIGDHYPVCAQEQCEEDQCDQGHLGRIRRPGARSQWYSIDF